MDHPVVVEVTGIAAGGAGVGRLADGRAIFVHRTAPGERVEVRVTASKPRWARGELVRVLRASPHRRAAPCPYYDRCGGCTLEHLDYGAQLAAKRTRVTDALRRIAGIAVPEPEVVGSPAELRYRNRVSFTLRRLPGARVVAGFHELGRAGRVLDVSGRCLLPEPAIAAAWDGLRRGWGENASRLPSGGRLRLTLRAGAGETVALLVEGGYAPGKPDELLERVPGLMAIWHRAEGADEPVPLAGEPLLAERWGDDVFEVAGDVFVQVNRGAAAALHDHVHALAGDVAGRRVLDAYCGVGIHALALARRGARAVGVDANGRAVEAARRAARAGGVAGAEFVTGRVEDRLGTGLPADLVIVNPPRAGLAPEIPVLLKERPSDLMLYVSCDPATLARDLGRLAPVFGLRSVRCFDLFPQTAHVETVVELRCDTT